MTDVPVDASGGGLLATMEQAISVSSVHSHDALRAGSAPGPRLALAFAQHCEPYRGYGPGPVTVLRLIHTGTPWPPPPRSTGRAPAAG
ncbi:hypothetical protein AMK25_18865 [Micromonospora sp. TSRI0369]|nr:hypothetical protein AMK25_18865 [Micromonospora sp. TSRI0369]